MMLVHAEANVPHVVVEEILSNAQPLHGVDNPILPLGECHVIEGCVLRVRLGMSGLKHLCKAPLVC
jgi:hypothetical protein